MKKLAIMAALAGLLPVVALAAYVGAGDSVMGPSVSVAQNVYLAGGTVNVSNPVMGDATVVGGTIILSGRVDRDILAIGGNVNLVGGSAEDVRVAGGSININERVNGEVVAAGGEVTITPDTYIARDSYIAGGSVVFAGTENGNLTIAGGNVHIDGAINGNLKIKYAEKVTFGQFASVKGVVEYSAPVEATISEGARFAFPPVFTRSESLSNGMRAQIVSSFIGVAFVMKTLALLLAAYLLWHFRKHDVTTVIGNIHGHAWEMILTGFAALVLTPVAGIILFATVIGSIPAMIMFLSYGVLLVLSSVVAVIVTASLIMGAFKKSRVDLKWYHILLGALVFGLLNFIPIAGWLVCFVIYLASIGATMRVLKAKLV